MMRGLAPCPARLPGTGGVLPTHTELRHAAERRSDHDLADLLRGLQTDLRRGMAHSAAIPEHWHEIARRAPVPGQEKLTLRPDADVAALFRRFGPGHLTRMNAVLRTLMLARQAEVVKGAGAVDYTMIDAEHLRDAIAPLPPAHRRSGGNTCGNG